MIHGKILRETVNIGLVNGVFTVLVSAVFKLHTEMIEIQCHL